MNDKFETINKAGEFRIFLHRLLMENIEYVEILKLYINNEFETISIEHTNCQTIQFKIKKSDLKKKPNFTHTVDFYYDYIDNAIYSFLTDPTVQFLIYEQIRRSINTYELITVYDELRQRTLSPRCLYSLTTAQDNIVVLNI